MQHKLNTAWAALQAHVGHIPGKCNSAEDIVSACLDADCHHVQVIANRHCAFVTYAERSAAERAVDELQHKLIVRGQRCKLMWGKPQEKRAPIEARDPAGADMLPTGPPPTSMIPPQVCHPPGRISMHGAPSML